MLWTKGLQHKVYIKILQQNLLLRVTKSLPNNKTYKSIMNGTCQSNNLIHILESNWYNIKCVGQTKNRIIDRFQGHSFDMKYLSNTTLTRHFASHENTVEPEWLYMS